GSLSRPNRDSRSHRGDGTLLWNAGRCDLCRAIFTERSGTGRGSTADSGAVDLTYAMNIATSDERVAPSARPWALLLQRDCQTVANRQDGREQIVCIVKQPVELEYRFGGSFGRILLRHSPAPQNVVRNQQSAFAQLGNRDSKYSWIVFFVDVVENNVEFLLLLREQFEGVADSDSDAVGDSGPFEVFASLLGILGVAIGVDDPAVLAHSTGPPNGGITNSGAHFENILGAHDHSQLVEDASDRRTDDRYFAPCSFRFHFCENFISRRKHGVKIIFDGVHGYAAHAPVGVLILFCQRTLSIATKKQSLPVSFPTPRRRIPASANRRV